MKKGNTNVYVAPNGEVFYDMEFWYRCLGSNGQDWGNHMHLPEGSVQVVKKRKRDG